MSVLAWFGVAVAVMVLGTVGIHLWVYSGTRAYYLGMLDAYKRGAQKMNANGGGNEGGRSDGGSKNDPSEVTTTPDKSPSRRRSRHH